MIQSRSQEGVMSTAALAKDPVAEARAAGDTAAVRNALLDRLALLASETSDLVARRDARAVEAKLAEWARELELVKADLLDRQLLYCHSRFQASSGTWAETRGLEAYFLLGDFVDAPRLMQAAEVHHE